MKTLNYWLIISTIFFNYHVLAQQGITGNSRNTPLTGPKILSGFETQTAELPDASYLDTEWALAKVKFYPRIIGTLKGTVKLDSLDDIQMRVVLQGNDVEFKTSEGIKVLSGSLIQQFSAQKANQPIKNYISVFEFLDETEKLKSGFFEILANGKLKLLEYTRIIINKSDNPSGFHVASNKDTKIIKEKLLYFARGKEVIILNNKKDLYVAMADQKPAIEKFIKENNLNTKGHSDLLKIFDYYNSL